MIYVLVLILFILLIATTIYFKNQINYIYHKVDTKFKESEEENRTNRENILVLKYNIEILSKELKRSKND